MTAPRKPRRHTPAPAGTAVGYVRVSTEEQAVSGLGLDAQRATITARAAALGLTIVGWFADEGISGTVAPLDRPGLKAALDAMATGKAERLMVAKLDRLGRNAARVLDLDTLAAAEGWGITLCDLDLDTTTAAGRFMLGNLANVAEFERNLISERTRAALAVKKAQGQRLGRPQKLHDDVVLRIITERDGGRTLQAIADGLRADGIATAQGGTWAPSNVRAVLKSQRAADLRTSQA